MNNKLIWGALCLAALATGCSSTPRWDESVFPNQVYYDGNAPAQAVAEQKK